MAHRNEDDQAAAAYAEASALNSAAAHAAAGKKSARKGKLDISPVEDAVVAPLAATPAADAPVAELLSETSPAAIAVADVAAHAEAAPASTNDTTATEPATLLSKGQTMITEATAQMTEEATRLGTEAKARTEAMVGDIQVRAKAAAEKGQELAKDAVDFSKGNVEAVVESMKIAARGMTEMGQELAGFARQSVTETTEAAKRYAAVKSPTEFFQLQSELSKTALDTAVKNGAKATEMTVKLANDAFQPISNRIAVAMSKLKNAA